MKCDGHTEMQVDKTFGKQALEGSTFYSVQKLV